MSAQLRKFLNFLLKILKGTPASQGASKWRNWEADNSSRTRVRPIHVICEDWGLCCSPLQLACCMCCWLQSLTMWHQDAGASNCAEHLSSSVLAFIAVGPSHWGCHWAQSWSLKRSQRGIMRKSAANPSLISILKNIDMFCTVSQPWLGQKVLLGRFFNLYILFWLPCSCHCQR